MNKTLSQLLAEARGAPIRFGDVEVRAIYEIDIRANSMMQVSFVHSTSAAPQALRVKAEGATLTVNAVTVKEAIYWTDTAPKDFDVSVVLTRTIGKLKMWNEWRSPGGLQNAWIGNAGMVVVDSGSELLLKCADGIGEPTFDDLIVQIRIIPDVVPDVVDLAAHRLKRERR